MSTPATRPASRIATAAPRLGLVGVEVLESVYQHRLLSTAQIHRLHTPAATRQWTRRVLARLHQLGLVEVTRAPGGMGLWYLTERGALTVETLGDRAEPRRKLLAPEHAAGPLQAHTLAVNDVGVAFVEAARERGDECGPLAWRHEIHHPLGTPPGRRYNDHLIADALLTYQLTAPDGPSTFYYRFVELDRATLQVADLAEKLARYARLHDYTPAPTRPGRAPVALWRHSYPVFPTLLVVLDGNRPRPLLERRREKLLALCTGDERLRATPAVEIAVCLLDDLTSHGPFAAIFRILNAPDTPADWLGQPA